MQNCGLRKEIEHNTKAKGRGGSIATYLFSDSLSALVDKLE